MIRTILIDDEPLARDVVKHYLKSYTDIEIIAECNDGFEGLKAITQFRPDFISWIYKCLRSMALKCWSW